MIDIHSLDADDLPPDSHVVESLEWAVQRALDQDWDLIALGGHEQAIAHRIAFYLESRFSGFHVDCEYNRQKHRSKVYCGEKGETTMRPDIIVHRRNSDSNVLAVEMKANANKNSNNDMVKLKALKAAEEGYVYNAIAFVEVINGVNEIKDGVLTATVTWFDLKKEQLTKSRATSLACERHHRGVEAIIQMRLKEKQNNDAQ